MDAAITLISCAGKNLNSGWNYYSVDLYDAPKARIKCINSGLGSFYGFARINEQNHIISGLRLRSQANSSYTYEAYDAEINPIVGATNLRKDPAQRFELKNNRVATFKFEQDLAYINSVYFADRIKLWEDDNRCFGFRIKVNAIAPSAIASASYIVKYNNNDGVIDASNGTIFLASSEGDDIFASEPADGKVSFTISPNASGLQIYASNKTGNPLHIYGKIEAFLNTSVQN